MEPTCLTVTLNGYRGRADVEMRVDSSLYYTVVSQALADSLGLEGFCMVDFRSRDGRLKGAEMGEAVMEYSGLKARVPLLISPNEEPVLGETALQLLNLRPNLSTESPGQK